MFEIQPQIDIRRVWFCVVAIFLAAAIAGCAGQKRAKTPAARGAPSASQSGPPPHTVSCREYADQTAGRELQREYDVMSGNFRGGDSPLFQEFARMDAVKYRRQLYESCLSNQRAQEDRVK